MKHFFTKKKDTNYLYFSAFLFFLILMSSLHHIEPHPLFFLYATIQALLETLLCLLLLHLLPLWTTSLGAAAIFILLGAHFVNFILVRMLDSTLASLINFFFLSGISHLIAGLQALNLNFTTVLIFWIGLITIPLLGIGLYKLTHRVSKRKPFQLSIQQITLTALLLFCSLCLLDTLTHPHLSPKNYTLYKKRLPLGSTILSLEPKYLSPPLPFKQQTTETQAHATIGQFKAEKLPNIYFFIIETFRKDYLSCAPTLLEFGKEHINIENSFANADATNLSWFSLFSAELPFSWSNRSKTWEKGSIPLHMLKQLGYQIHLYASADLSFYHMDELLFGKNLTLIDHFGPSLTKNLLPCQKDALVMQQLQNNLSGHGNAYFIFLDSPHSEYSFPDDFPLQYEPICQNINYLTINKYSKELELIKNRYRNSIAYIDSLFAPFFKQLKEKNLYEEALIVITGDHGEEFFEEGALFHGSHLNCYQTHVPILFKCPEKSWEAKTDSVTHIDLFPSILHCLTNKTDFGPLFDGQSMFVPKITSSRIAVQQNGPDTPTEFSLTTDEIFLHAHRKDSDRLEIIELISTKDL